MKDIKLEIRNGVYQDKGTSLLYLVELGSLENDENVLAIRSTGLNRFLEITEVVTTLDDPRAQLLGRLILGSEYLGEL